MKHWLESDVAAAWERAAGLQVVALIALACLVWRAGAARSPFHELHYEPAANLSGVKRCDRRRPPIDLVGGQARQSLFGADQLWLAAASRALRPLHRRRRLVAFLMGQRISRWRTGPAASRLGDRSRAAGPVPAAFQYGLWDSTTQDRCRRLNCYC